MVKNQYHSKNDTQTATSKMTVRRFRLKFTGKIVRSTHFLALCKYIKAEYTALEFGLLFFISISNPATVICKPMEVNLVKLDGQCSCGDYW